jgi:hypothetical protein
MTAGHVEAPGTGAYFVLAKDMSLSDRFSGFASEARGIEVVVANIKSPYNTISEAFTDSTLKTRGLEVGSKATLTINGADATLFKALHQEEGKKWGKWILLLDSGQETIVVNGMFVSGDGDAARDVEMMLKSVVVKNEAPKDGSKNDALAEGVSPDERTVINDGLAAGVSPDERMSKDDDPGGAVSHDERTAINNEPAAGVSPDKRSAKDEEPGEAVSPDERTPKDDDPGEGASHDERMVNTDEDTDKTD